MFSLQPAARLCSASYFHCAQRDCSSVSLNQALCILKLCLSKTCVCARLISPSKPHGMLNLKPLVRPIDVNLNCIADLKHYNFSEDVPVCCSFRHQNWPGNGLGSAGNILNPATGMDWLSQGLHPQDPIVQQRLKVLQLLRMEKRDLEARGGALPWLPCHPSLLKLHQRSCSQPAHQLS